MNNEDTQRLFKLTCKIINNSISSDDVEKNQTIYDDFFLLLEVMYLEQSFWTIDGITLALLIYLNETLIRYSNLLQYYKDILSAVISHHIVRVSKGLHLRGEFDEFEGAAEGFDL